MSTKGWCSGDLSLKLPDFHENVNKTTEFRGVLSTKSARLGDLSAKRGLLGRFVDKKSCGGAAGGADREWHKKGLAIIVR